MIKVSQLSGTNHFLFILVCLSVGVTMHAQNHVGIGTSTPGYSTGYSILSINSSDAYTANRTSLLELKGSSNSSIIPKSAVRFLSHTGVVVGEIGSYGLPTNLINGGSLFFKTSLANGDLTTRMRILGNGVVAVGDGTESQFDTSAVMDVRSTAKGFFIPRMSTAQRAAIPSPGDGLLVYDNTEKGVWHVEDGTWHRGIGSYRKIDMDDTHITVDDSGTDGKLIFATDNIEVLRVEKNAAGIYRWHTLFQNHNLFMGYVTGQGATNVIQGSNTAFGSAAMASETFSGFYNSAFGTFALTALNSGIHNSAFGRGALADNVSGNNNTAMGSAALSNATGAGNTAIGAFSMSSIEAGESNVALGYQAGNSDDGASSRNVYLGTRAGSKLLINSSLKSRNVMIGYEAGSESEGDDNIFIGYQAGQNETANNRLYIDNSNTASPLILGNFATNALKINGTFETTDDVGIGVVPGAYKLEVGGVINAASGLSGSTVALRAQGDEAIWYNGTFFSWGFGGSWNRFADSVRIGGATSPSHLLMVDGVARSTQSTWATSSDVRVKENVRTVNNALETLRKFRPVTFDWTSAYTSAHPSLHDENYGFIAQEVEKIIPSMVATVHEKFGDTSIDDFKVLSTDALIPLLVKSVQEQDAIIASLQSQLTQQQTQLKALVALLNQSENAVGSISVK